MPTWPTVKAGTTHLDAGSDNPGSARADIKQNVDNVNDMIDTIVVTSPTATQVLSYDNGDSRFENVDIDTIAVTTSATQTLTNKTLTTPIISSISNTGTVTLPTSTDTLVGKATTDTLTNKTLTSPVISSISNTGTLTLPTSTDTLVGKATTDTFTNKSGNISQWTNDGGYALTNVANTWTKQQVFGMTTLTDASSIAWDLDDNQVAQVTLGGNRALANPTNKVAGATYILIVKQDVSSTRTLSYGSDYKFPGGTAPVLTNGASAVDILSFISDGTYLYGSILLDFS